MKILNFINVRTFLALIISQVAAFLVIHFQIKFHLDLLLFGLCVVFPLHFSMQAAFKRRDRALEYFSLFKAGSMAMHYSFQVSEDLAIEKKQQAASLLKIVVTQLFDQLEDRRAGFARVQQKLDEVFLFIQNNHEEISKRNVLRMIRYLKDVTESSTFLISLVNHRTMVGLRFYTIFFIVIFPMIQAPIVLHRLDGIVPYWLIHLFLGLTS